MKIYVIGDSISINYGHWLETALAGTGVEYSRKLSSDDTLDGDANGGDSSKVLAYLNMRAVALPIEADVLLVNCGLHDIKADLSSGEHQVDIESYRRNLEGIASVVTETMGKKMVWIRTTPCDDAIHNRPGIPFRRTLADVVEYNRVADVCMAARGIPEIDLFTFTKNCGTPAEIYFDHIHFKEATCRAQGAFIAGWLDAWKRSR